jgi:hypothetical protein
MMKGLAILALLFSVQGYAHADCGTFPKLAVQVTCNAQLLGSAPSKPFEGKGKKVPLGPNATGKGAEVRFADYIITGELSCHGPNPHDGEYEFDVKLTEQGRPYASPIHFPMVANLGLETRLGLKPLKVLGIYFFETGKPVEIEGKKFTRLDYSCELAVTTP